jgi:hypothetical protein
MALMPTATWIGPTPNDYIGGMTGYHGLVLHIEEGSDAGSRSWFTNPQSSASAHFLNPKSGNLEQLVDTKDAAWAEVAGNHTWISVEHEGHAGDSLTASQLENDAQLMAWLHTEHGIPLQSTDDPNGSGLGWHGMGGDAWGGHFDCPGDPIKAQRGAILARAAQILGQPVSGGSTPSPAPQGPTFPGEYLSVKSPMLHDGNVSTWQQKMHDRGWTITVDGWYGNASAGICKQFQAEKGLTADGIVGPVTWAATWNSPVT